MRKTVTNWGNYPRIEADFYEPSSAGEIRDRVIQNEEIIARGNGRCYGDSSLAANIFSTLRLDRFLAFDRENGTIECESGVLLSEILNVIVPSGYFLPVTPGTKFITLGGAIAADVHGKNHHIDGSFSAHVISLRLMTASGDVVTCSRDENAGLFWQTCGGMGLTGIILSAAFRLKPIETSFIRLSSQKARDIDEVMALFDASAGASYSVAWLDCFAGRVGRSILRLGEHASIADLPASRRSEPLAQPSHPSFSLPFFMPRFSVNYLTVKSFNFFYYHKELDSRRERLEDLDAYFYPLDGIYAWNRVYGRRGFLQYQFVLPKERSHDGLVKILEEVRHSGQGSPLAVLKLFGPADPQAVMSFPREGYTLALDFKVNDAVLRLLDELDELVLEYGGRIYLAKDARMKADIFRRSYDQVVSSGRFRSMQAERLRF